MIDQETPFEIRLFV